MLIAKLTDDVELRLLEQRHVDALFALAQENLERLYWLPRALVREDIESRVRAGIENLAKGGGFLGGIFEKDEICGVVALMKHDPDFKTIELGYWIGARAEGRGLVTKACRAAMRHGFDDLKVHRMELRCHEHNARSIAVAERLGFRREGVFKQSDFVGGAWIDFYVYGMLEDEWRQQQK